MRFKCTENVAKNDIQGASHTETERRKTYQDKITHNFLAMYITIL